MTFPTSFYTPNRIFRLALKDAGLLQQGAEPTAEQMQDGLERMADMIALWQTQGLKLWLNSMLSINLSAGVASYALGPGGAIITPKPTRVLDGWFVQPSGARYGLNLLGWNEYQSLGNLTQQGAINSFFVDKQQANVVVSFWQVPDSTAALGTAELLIQRQAAAPSALDETVLFPTEWYLALRWGLADEFASGQPPLIADRCERKAREYRQLLEDWDVEDASTHFQVNTAGVPSSRFR